MVIAGVAMSVWGGPRRRVSGILGFAFLMGVAMVVGSLRPNPVLIAGGAFVVLASSAIVMACNQAVWQTKVDPQLRGRVLALLTMAFSAPPLLAYALAGFTADRVFVPLVGRSEVHSPVVRMLVGTGAGRGFALLIMVMGALIMVSALGAALYPRLRHLDAELPDMIVDQDHSADAPYTTDTTDEPEVIAAPEPAAAGVPVERVIA
jgi:MFS family permease